MAEQAAEYREKLLEQLADVDDAIAEKYLEGEEIDVATLKAAIRQARRSPTWSTRCSPARRSRTRASSPCSTRSSTTCPRRWTSTTSPARCRTATTPAERKADESEPLSALAFKIATDPHLGKLTFVRIYSGVLDNGSQVLNSTKDRKERIGKIYQMHANKREELRARRRRRHHRRRGSEADHHR